jgi:hypothetical protein
LHRNLLNKAASNTNAEKGNQNHASTFRINHTHSETEKHSFGIPFKEKKSSTIPN